MNSATRTSLSERLVTLTRRYQGRVYIFENVPALVCPHCGHRYFDGLLMLQLERLMQETPPEARPLEAYAFAYHSRNKSIVH